MPDHLTLDPDTDAPAHARRWVRGQLLGLGRADLVETASLGVSELVTNALLHAGGDIAVRISDTNGRLRVEVYDNSPSIPERPATVGVGQDNNPSTVGRGLQILDAISLAWGVYDEHDGKCIWFQPSAVGLPMWASGGPLMSAVPHRTPVAAEELVQVRLLGSPVLLFARYRTRLKDLRREMTLMSLDEPLRNERIPPGDRPNRQHEPNNHQAQFNSQVDDAIAAGLEQLDVELELARSDLPELHLLRDVLRQLGALPAGSRLLTLAPGPQELATWEWFFHQVLGQAEGAEPQRWTGDYHVTDPEPPAG